jgi:uncharacterized protein (DUF924 family)
MATPELEAVLTYWFNTLTPADWFRKSAALDADIGKRFGVLLGRLAHETVEPADLSAREALAVVIVLDQFSRNIYRDKPEAFASDAKALGIAQQLVADGRDQMLSPEQRVFLYMPYMHSEELDVHDQALNLFTRLGFATHIKYERQHRDIIARFGRYPHRNRVLGRKSRAEELAFLKQPNSSF